MPFFSDLTEHLEMLRSVLGADVVSEALPLQLATLDDEGVVEVMSAATAIIRIAEIVRITAAGVAGARSTHQNGHAGLAQTRGHRSPVTLVQELTGTTRADAIKHVRLGEALLRGVGVSAVGVSGADTPGTALRNDSAEPAPEPEPEPQPQPQPEPEHEPWHAPLAHALLGGIISSAQHEAILRGLGEPTPAADRVWSLAAEQLSREAAERTVEELARAARTVRDQLDPEGAQLRFDERFERRSFRTWTDADGVRRASIVFDDLAGAWVQAIIVSALRPRRGGPRFVDAAEKARADELAADPRSNDQLAYDLIVDVLRAGALADAATVFGTRQAGVRVLISATDLAAGSVGAPATGLIEDELIALPAWLVAQQRCDTGTIACTTDRDGNPLDLGREERLFSARQRIALAIRDGGCRWHGCDRPSSYCEAHHIDHFSEGGRTDVDRGILLCRYHHMQLHHGGWRITRAGRGDFILHPPPGPGEAIPLHTRLALRYAWRDADPPPKRFRPAA